MVRCSAIIGCGKKCSRGVEIKGSMCWQHDTFLTKVKKTQSTYWSDDNELCIAHEGWVCKHVWNSDAETLDATGFKKAEPSDEIDIIFSKIK